MKPTTIALLAIGALAVYFVFVRKAPTLPSSPTIQPPIAPGHTTT